MRELLKRNPIPFLLSDENIDEAVHQVKINKGAPGPDGMKASILPEWMAENRQGLKQSIAGKSYKPEPVRRVYIPKANGKKRPLGIPNVKDRAVQQMAAQLLEKVFEPVFSPYSYGFCPYRNAQGAVLQAIEYLNEGYEWVIDFDIEKFFDRVNHDKLISCIRKEINDSTFLHLIRGFLKAGVMENGVKVKTEEGTPQGGPISPILANIYLTELDRELESRGLHFVRYADDFLIFVRSEPAAQRVMNSVSKWIKAKLLLNVSAEKTKVVRPTKSKFLGFTFMKSSSEKKWICRPHNDSKRKLVEKTKEILCRRRAVNISLNKLEWKLALTVRGWINYYKIGAMKTFIDEYGQWMRHKVRVVILKKWKNRSTILKNLLKIRRHRPAYFKNAKVKQKILKFRDDEVFAQCYTRCGWYRLAGNSLVNYILHPVVLGTQVPRRYGLIDPLNYYLGKPELYKWEPQK